jgi:hypothetical protein
VFSPESAPTSASAIEMPFGIVRAVLTSVVLARHSERLG